MNFFAYKSKFIENKFPIYVIINEDPRMEKDWDNPSYEKVFIGCFETYQQALFNIRNIEPNFFEWEELNDSYLQGETVFFRS